MLADAILLIAAAMLLSRAAQAGDWPQILGPHRNGHADHEQLSESWPPAGPKVAWRYPLGSGYAGAAVVGDWVVVFHRVGSNERVECLMRRGWKVAVESGFPATYQGGIDPDTGPRCVPLLANGVAYCFGAGGDLYAVALESGKKLWTRSLYADYHGDEGYFGAGSTPVLVGGRLLVNVGGRGAGIVALDPASGKTIWNASDEAASYSSPAAADIGGKPQAVFITRMNCVSADPQTGNVEKLFAFGKRGPTVNAATPLIVGDKLFVTSSYSVGAELASLSGKEIWSNDDRMSSQYATPVEKDGFRIWHSWARGRWRRGAALHRAGERQSPLVENRLWRGPFDFGRRQAAHPKDRRRNCPRGGRSGQVSATGIGPRCQRADACLAGTFRGPALVRRAAEAGNWFASTSEKRIEKRASPLTLESAFDSRLAQNGQRPHAARKAQDAAGTNARNAGHDGGSSRVREVRQSLHLHGTPADIAAGSQEEHVPEQANGDSRDWVDSRALQSPSHAADEQEGIEGNGSARAGQSK